MFMTAALFTLLAAQAGPIDVPDRTPLTIAWSSSPRGAGSSALGFADDPPHAWVKNFDPLPTSPQTQDYFTFVAGPDGPGLWLNTAGRTVFSNGGGFTLTASSTGPLKLVFHCADAGGTGWGNGLDVTITGP